MSIYEREITTLNWKGKALVLLGAPIALAGAFLSTLLVEVGVAAWRAAWQVRWEYNRIRSFLR